MAETFDPTPETEVQSEPATEEATPKAPRAPAAVLSADGLEPLKVLKYPMPTKAAGYCELDINGAAVKGAFTTFKDFKYTYFQIGAVSYYVKGHLDPALEYTFTFPEGYDAEPARVNRAERAAKAAAVRKSKKASTPETAGSESEYPPASSETASEGDGSPPTSETPVEASAQPSAKAKRKASR